MYSECYALGDVLPLQSPLPGASISRGSPWNDDLDNADGFTILAALLIADDRFCNASMSSESSDDNISLITFLIPRFMVIMSRSTFSFNVFLISSRIVKGLTKRRQSAQS